MNLHEVFEGLAAGPLLSGPSRLNGLVQTNILGLQSPIIGGKRREDTFFTCRAAGSPQ